MTSHIETRGTDVPVTWVRPGGLVGEDRMALGTYALVLGDDNQAVFIGTPEELVELHQRLGNALEAIEHHTTAALTITDMFIDDDHDVACPRCEWSSADPQGYETFADLSVAVHGHISSHGGDIRPRTA